MKGRNTGIGIFLVTVIVVVLLLNHYFPRQSSKSELPPSSTIIELPPGTPAPASPEPPAKRTPEDDAIMATVAILMATNDPDSVSVDNAVVTDKAVCISFRARNPFNALMPGQFVISRDLKDGAFSWEKGFAAKWNSRCAKQTATDATSTVSGNLKYNRRALMRMANR
jgi:hypothetical protein